MALWLYTLTNEPDTQGYFECVDGKVDAISENFIECIMDGRLKETTWWVLEICTRKYILAMKCTFMVEKITD